MAKSPGHKFGQIIGDLLEAAISPLLQRFATDTGLFLDRKGPRSCRRGKRVRWEDHYGNSHDLDFVLERHGSPTKMGIPVAFVESAWRRSSRHSRNKAQEVQGAIMPLSQKYSEVKPFCGAILAGVFTDGALTQLRSLGFHVLYIPYETVVSAFATEQIEASYDDETSDADFRKKIASWTKLSTARRDNIAKALLDANAPNVEAFLAGLRQSVERRIERVIVIPLHGNEMELASIEAANQFLDGNQDVVGTGPLVAYRVIAVYGNGDRIEREFNDKRGALRFLEVCRASQAA